MQPQDPNSPSNPNAQPPSPEAVPNQPQQMYYTRPLEPQRPEISEEIKQKHDASAKRYPSLNLSDGEYVISDVRRHPIGLIGVWTFVVLVVVVVITGLALFMVSDISQSMTIPATVLGIGALLICALALIGGYIGTFVYRANRFYLTNESVIQNIQFSLFSNREQTVSLGSIEDASYTKNGIIQHMLDYGSIRLSTVGDETTYRFHYASSPEKQVALLNNAVEAFKNGRPVDHHGH